MRTNYHLHFAHVKSSSLNVITASRRRNLQMISNLPAKKKQTQYQKTFVKKGLALMVLPSQNLLVQR